LLLILLEEERGGEYIERVDGEGSKMNDALVVALKMWSI
jgi:hypothetical protein